MIENDEIAKNLINKTIKTEKINGFDEKIVKICPDCSYLYYTVCVHYSTNRPNAFASICEQKKECKKMFILAKLHVSYYGIKYINVDDAALLCDMWKKNPIFFLGEIPNYVYHVYAEYDDYAILNVSIFNVMKGHLS